MRSAPKANRVERASGYRMAVVDDRWLCIRPEEKRRRDGIYAYPISTDDDGRPHCHCPATVWCCVHMIRYAQERSRHLSVLKKPGENFVWFASGRKQGCWESHRVEHSPAVDGFRCDCRQKYCDGYLAVQVFLGFAKPKGECACRGEERCPVCKEVV